MDFIRLGNSGLKVSAIAFGTALTLGTERTDLEFAEQLIAAAWEGGIRCFDCANSYGNGNAEALLGQILMKYPRQEYIAATKCALPVGTSPYYSGLSRKHILWAVEESLSRLKTEYIDLYYAHRYDEEAPLLEVIRTFNHLIAAGKIRYWGTSEWSIAQLSKCFRLCEQYGLEKPIAEQFIYSFVVQKAEHNGVKAFCETNAVGMFGYSPLAQGILTGKYKGGIPKDSRIAKSEKIGYAKTINFLNQTKDQTELFLALCEEYHANPIGTALWWSIKNGIVPILGASSPEQLKTTLSCIKEKIPDDLFNRLRAISA